MVFFSSQHIVYFTKFILSYVIPDVPEALKEQIKRERYLTQVILHETNIKHFKELMKPVSDNLLDEIEEPELDLKLWTFKCQLMSNWNHIRCRPSP